MSHLDGVSSTSSTSPLGYAGPYSNLDLVQYVRMRLILKRETSVTAASENECSPLHQYLQPLFLHFKRGKRTSVYGGIHYSIAFLILLRLLIATVEQQALASAVQNSTGRFVDRYWFLLLRALVYSLRTEVFHATIKLLGQYLKVNSNNQLYRSSPQPACTHILQVFPARFQRSHRQRREEYSLVRRSYQVLRSKSLLHRMLDTLPIPA
jgi:hypothetical protein